VSKISIGPATIIGIVTAIPGAINIVLKVVQEGQGITVTGPDKWLALFTLVSGGIVLLASYAQATAEKLKGK
jgi:hypothetical protein